LVETPNKLVHLALKNVMFLQSLWLKQKKK
jgi:hypothetical protein